MKKSALLTILYLSSSFLYAQYDFPVVINGLSISLDFNGQRTVHPEQWIQSTITDCYPDSLLISRTVFPRDTVPPAGASDSLVFNCDDFVSESIEIWWKGQENEWLVTDSYALINGFERCDCDQDCSTGSHPIVLNGLSTTLGNGDSVMVAAKDLIATVSSGITYSFTADPADSLQTFYCSTGPIANVEIFAHQAGLQSLSTQTYIDFNIQNCGLGTANDLLPKVIQGLSVPSGPGGIVSVPARAFAIPNEPNQQLAYSEEPTDTLLTVNCNLIGSGGVTATMHRHNNGQVGPAVISYLIPDNGRLFCNPSDDPFPVNDNFSSATILDSCKRFGQFYLASVEAEEPMIDPELANAGSVWYQFNYLDVEGLERTLSIHPVDSLYYAIYPAFSTLSSAPTAFATGLLTTDSTINLCWPGEAFDSWFLQLQQLETGANCRYFLHLGSEPDCPSNSIFLTNEVAKLTLSPNPSNDYVSISNNFGQAANISNISVFNTSGQLVDQLNLNPFRIGHLQMGVYWVIISLNNGQRFVEKLIKI